MIAALIGSWLAGATVLPLPTGSRVVPAQAEFSALAVRVPEPLLPEALAPRTRTHGALERGSGRTVRGPSIDGALPIVPLAASPHPSRSSGGDLEAALRSLFLPGWGQHHRDRSHWWAYPLVEAGALAGWLQGRSRGSSVRERYRDLAWDVARTPVWSGDRTEGPWEYYERMSQWTRSGAFDRSPDPGLLLPETDPSTYNGSIWALAKQLHLEPDATGGSVGLEGVERSSPEYRRALDYYRERAIPPELGWDWSDASEAQVRFRRLIDSSDEAFRRATTFVGLVFLNHFISATEAWLHERSAPLQHIPFQLDAGAGPLAEPGRWTFQLRILPRRSRSSR